MKILLAQDLTFKYRNSEKNILNNISFSVDKGDFAVICGKSGCGKTTLLRLIKSSLSPDGDLSGSLLCRFDDSKIGYVFQNPESQIVMDNVFDELIFGCENLGMDTSLIRLRLSEITAYLGIEDLLDKKCSTLSGGQKQLINLASIMMMEPELIILDEPFSMLDPIASATFLSILTRLHTELGITIIICEHDLDNILKIASSIIYFTENDDANSLVTFDSSDKFIDYVITKDKTYIKSLPSLVNFAVQAKDNNTITFDDYPLTVSDWKNYLSNQPSEEFVNFAKAYQKHSKNTDDDAAVCIKLKNLCFRYEKALPDIINHLNLTIKKGDFFAIIGGNGAGKTTLLSLLTGYRKPYSGKIKITGSIGYLPQNPAYAFVEDNVWEDLRLLCKNNSIPYDRIHATMEKYPVFLELKDYFDCNPLDLSGGQMQLMALFKILLLSPDILLLDEPTKGLDGFHKAKLSDLLQSLRADGTTIVMVSHDLVFVSENATDCGMMFQGDLSVSDSCNNVLGFNHFYTTPVYRILKGLPQ